MARVLSGEARWDLAAFADRVLGDAPIQMSPREAGSACERFTDEFASWVEAGLDAEQNTRYAEDQIATALVSIATLGGGGFFRWEWVGPTFGWPIVVVHGARNARRYATLFQDLQLPEWSAGRPEAFPYPVGAIDFDYARGLLRSRPRLAAPWTGERLDLLARAVVELGKAWDHLPSVMMPRLPRRPTAAQPNPAMPVTVPGASASVGVTGRSGGRDVATTAAHFVGPRTAVSVAGTSCSVLYVDHVQDAAMIDVTGVTVPATTIRGPLAGVAPAGGITHTFIGAVSGAGSDPVIAWDAAIPWIPPNLPVQAHVYTGCVTQPGDSGAVLLNPAGRSVGFAHFASPAAAPTSSFTSPSPGLSGWVWAEAVYTSLAIV